MGKKPSFPFYPNDWNRDMEEHPLEMQGAWIVLLTKLWWSETRGKATKTLDEWARILRITRRKTSKILTFFEQKHVANIEGLVNQNGMQNITITSRRMVRDDKISRIRAECGRLGGHPKLKNSGANLVKQNDMQNGTLPIPSPFPSPKKEDISSTDSKNPPTLTKDQLSKIVTFYKSHAGKNQGWQFTQKRKQKIVARAKEAIKIEHDPVLYIEECIRGTVADPWCAGDNPDSKRYVELEEHCIRSTEQAEKRHAYFHTLQSTGKESTVYVCSRPGCDIETDKPWHKSGDTVYCSQRCEEEAKR